VEVNEHKTTIARMADLLGHILKVIASSENGFNEVLAARTVRYSFR
jgi:hypothetical protein